MKIAQPKLGPRLRRTRIDLGHNLSQGAKLAGIAKSQLFRIEKGGEVTLRVLNQILDAYRLRLIVTNK